MLLEVVDHAALGRHVVVHQGEAGVGAEEGDELVLHAILRPLELAVGPAEDLPALMDHAVLLQQVVGVLVLGDFGGVMPGGAVHLYGDPAVCAGEGIVDGAVFAVDVREGILQIDILPLLGAEDIAEELDELFLRAAVAGAGCFFHGHDGLLAGAKCSGGRRERGKSPFVAYCSCAELEAGTSHEVSSAAQRRGEEGAAGRGQSPRGMAGLRLLLR